MSKLRKATARQVSFPTDLIFKSYDDGSSFKKSFAAALRHLIDQKMIVQMDEKLSVAASIRDMVLKVKIPPIGPERRILRDERVLPDREPEFKFSMESFLADLPKMSLERMKQYYDAAESASSAPRNLTVMSRALAVQENIRAELVRRRLLRDDEPFHWPSTLTHGGDGSLVMPPVPKQSPLKAMGYSVGRKGDTAEGRQAILSAAFLGQLPVVEGMEKWGTPESGTRLRKMANNLASMTKLAKRRSGDHSDAIRMREEDLNFLRSTYYEGRFDGTWVWPSTSV